MSSSPASGSRRICRSSRRRDGAAAHSVRPQDRGAADRASASRSVKFGQIIGFASQPIAAGDWVHEHNCAWHGHDAFERDYAFLRRHAADRRSAGRAERRRSRAFAAPTARSGTRNYLGILTSVNCSATVAKFMAEAVNRSGILDDYPNIDGVVPFVHGTGCAMDLKRRRLRHPDAHAVGLYVQPQSRRRAAGRARLRGVPDRPHEGSSTASRRATPSRP